MSIVTNVSLISIFPNLLVRGTLEKYEVTVYREDQSTLLVKGEFEDIWNNDVRDYLKTVNAKQRRKVVTTLPAPGGRPKYITELDGAVNECISVSFLKEAVQNQCFLMEKSKLLLDTVSGVEMSLKNCENLKEGHFLDIYKTADWEFVAADFGRFLNSVLYDLSQAEGLKSSTLEAIQSCEDLYDKLPKVFKIFLDLSTSNNNYPDDNKRERRSKAASAFVKARNKNFLDGHQLQENITNSVVTTSKVSSIIMSRQGSGGSVETVRKLLRGVPPPPLPPPSLTVEGVDNTQKGTPGATDVFGQDRMYMSVAASHVSVEISESPDLAYNENMFPSKWLLKTLEKPPPELLDKLKTKKECDSKIMRSSLARCANLELKRLKEDREGPDPSQSSTSSCSEPSTPTPSQTTVPSQSQTTVPSQNSAISEKPVFDSQTSVSSQHSLYAEDSKEVIEEDFMDFESELSSACKAGDLIAVKRLIKDNCDHDLDEAINSACIGGNREIVEELCELGASLQNHLFYVIHPPGSHCVVNEFYNLHIPSKRLEDEKYQPRYFNPHDPEKRKNVTVDSKRGASYNHVPSNFQSTEPLKMRVNNIIATNPNSKEKIAALLRVVLKRKGYYINQQLVLPAFDGLPLSQCLDLQQNTYKCVCGLSFYGLLLFTSHFIDVHPDKELGSSSEYLEFRHVLFIGGAGHYYMNAMRGFADLIWDPLLKQFVETLSWETRNQLALMHRMGDTHLANQTLLCCLHGALFRKLVEDYLVYSDKQGQVPEGDRFVEWLQLEELDDHTRFEINCLLTLHGMTVFLEGLRRNNYDHFFAGIQFFNMIWFVRNHPIYRQLDLYLNILREILPFQLFVALFGHLSWSWTGEPTSGEHIDFIVENVNKQLKAILPHGQVTIKDWSDACLSFEFVYNIKKEVYSRFGIKNLVSEDQIHDFNYIEKQLPNLVKTLREIHDLNKVITYPKDLANFRNVGTMYRNNAIDDLANGIVAMRARKTEYIPGSLEEEQYFKGVECMTIEALRNEIASTIESIQCRRQQRQLSIKYDKHCASVGGKSLASLRKFLLQLREDVEKINVAEDNV